MTITRRLGAPFGRCIDTSTPLRFTFDGAVVEGVAGDTLASALVAAGHWTLSRSFKYHRPRGPMSFDGLEANTLVTLDGEPSVFADRVALRQGMQVRSQNVYGTLRYDAGRTLELISRFLPPGFYYRAFYRPRISWRLWEKVIRRMAGLGALDPEAGAIRPEKAYLHADVAVVGGGPAGLSAALAAADRGAEVVLVDEGPALGGSLLFRRVEPDRARTDALLRDLVDRVRAHRGIRIYERTVASGFFADQWMALLTEAGLVKLRARATIVAGGTVDQVHPFRGNDRPGVVFGRGAERLLGLYGVVPGRVAVIATASDAGYGLALDLADAGVAVGLIADRRGSVPETDLVAAVRARNLTVATNARPVATSAGKGGRLRQVTIDASGATFRVDADLLAVSLGIQPAASLLCQAGATLRLDPDAGWMMLSDLPPGVFAAGSVRGLAALDDRTEDGRRAGFNAARYAGFGDGGLAQAPTASPRNPALPRESGAALSSEAFIDFDEDLTPGDLRETVSLGYDHMELVKRFSTVGMGPSQGRHSSMEAARLVRDLRGETGPASPTTQRPPYRPEKFAVLAGPHHTPVRLTPMHDRHLEAGATMMNAGAWKRPAYYGPAGDRTAIQREVMAVRRHLGLIDVSTLGGFDIRGTDATEFLQRLYTGGFKTQRTGMGRYVLATDQTGAIIDDGIAAKLSDHHFYVTASTGATERMHRHFLWWNTQWRLDVDITNVTAAYGAMNLAGRWSRAVLQTLTDNIDLSANAFPYMGVREGHIAGIPARVLRAGFVGELGFEIHCPSGEAEALWDAILHAGRDHGIMPFGVEAQRLLRLEKGHIIIGQDTDGLTTPYEAAMGWAVADRKPFFVGQRAMRIRSAAPIKAILAGFRLDDGASCPEECTLVIRDGVIVGRVTSAALSPSVGRVIGLAYVAPDQAEIGARFDIRLSNGVEVTAETVSVPFYDPGNDRQKG